MPLALALYRAAWNGGLALTSPAWLCALAAGRWEVRRRVLPKRLEPGTAVWWHGASAGEVRALGALYAEAHAGELGASHASASTADGLAMWRQFGVASPSILPVDTGWAWRQALPDGLRLMVLTETELWPGMLRMLIRRRVPVAVASARLSERAFSWYRASGVLRGLMDALHVTAQSATDAERYEQLGVSPERIAVTGSLKWPREPGADRSAVREALGIPGGDPVVVAGSIRTREIERVVAALSDVKRCVPGIWLIIAPRSLSDVSYAERQLTETGWQTRRYRERSAGGGANAIVVDSMGDLARLYAATDLAVVGGSWEPVGGHNPFEAAVYGVPVVYGPEMRQAGCDLLEQSGQAVRVEAAGLAHAVIERLTERRTFDTVAWGDPVNATLTAWDRWNIAPREWRYGDRQ